MHELIKSVFEVTLYIKRKSSEKKVLQASSNTL